MQIFAYSFPGPMQTQYFMAITISTNELFTRLRFKRIIDIYECMLCLVDCPSLKKGCERI
jgi:hypothetical protein